MAFADQEEAGQILSQEARGRILVSRERGMAPPNQCFLVKNTRSSRLQVP
jgi:hypothetical protein